MTKCLWDLRKERIAYRKTEDRYLDKLLYDATCLSYANDTIKEEDAESIRNKYSFLLTRYKITLIF